MSRINVLARYSSTSRGVAAYIALTFLGLCRSEECDYGGVGKWGFNASKEVVHNLQHVSPTERGYTSCYMLGKPLRFDAMRWEYEYDAEGCKLHDETAEIPDTLWVGDSLLGQMHRAWSNMAAYRALHRPSPVMHWAGVLVNGYTLHPMTPSEWDHCNATRKPAQRRTAETRRCPPYDADNKHTLNGHTYGSTMESQAWTKRFENWTGRHLRDSALIMNTGHHWWKENNFLSDIPGCRSAKGVPWQEMNSNDTVPECGAFHKYPHMASNVVQYLQRQSFKGVVLFVTSPPGYPNCENASANTFPNFESHRTSQFHWLKPMLFEHYWREAFQMSNLRYAIVNVTYPTLLRGDAHPPRVGNESVDCLHLCPMGVPLFWVKVALTELQRVFDHE